MTMRKFHKDRRRVLAVQDSRFDMKIAGEIEMPVDGFSFLSRQFGNISTRQDINCEALGSKIVRHAPAATNKHRCCWLIGYMNQDAISRSFLFKSHIDFMSRLAERQFAKSRQRLFLEKIFEGAFGFIGCIHGPAP
jgi:hypothetical protein